jgi:putative oxidoreductase
LLPDGRHLSHDQEEAMAFTFMTPFHGATVAVLRIGAGLMFMQHGVQKLFGWLGGMGGQSAELLSQMWVAGVLETFGGLLIVLGLFTRPVALLLVLEMLAAYFIAHASRGLLPIQNGGELALLYAFIYLFFSAHGAGPFSLDAARGERVTTTTEPRTAQPV